MPTDDELIPPLSGLAPEREEIDRRHHHHRRAKARKSAPPRQPRGIGTVLLLFCLLALAALGGWNYLLYQQFMLASVRLEYANERLEMVEQRVVMNDDSVTESTDVVQGHLRKLDSEVRKLWDNVWKKAKRRLAEQDDALKALQTEVATGERREAQLGKSLSELQLALDVLEEQADSGAGVATEVAAASGQLALQQQQLAKLEKTLQRLQQASVGSAKQLQETQEWVASFNGYRTQVNRKLLDLQGSINALQGEP